MEISHRSKVFENLLAKAIAGIRELAGVPSNYRILFLQGRGEPSVSMVPMNFLRAGTTADYVDTGTWAVKAIEEAKRVGSVNVTGSTKDDQYSRIPDSRLSCGFHRLLLRAHHHQQHNRGTEWKTLPQVGDVPLVADASSDILSGPIEVARFGLIYAGAQKNLGPSGVTLLVMIEEDLLNESDDSHHHVELQGAGGEQLALQHSQYLRDLHSRPRHAGAKSWGYGLSGSPDQPAQGVAYTLRDRSNRLLS